VELLLKAKADVNARNNEVILAIETVAPVIVVSVMSADGFAGTHCSRPGSGE
jgi:hypothetical protein